LTSTSLDRAPGPSKAFVRGKSGYVPFWPGGLDDPLVPRIDGDISTTGRGLRTIAPGLSRGLRLPGETTEDDDLLDLEGLKSLKFGDEMVCLYIILFSLVYHVRRLGY